MFKSKRSQRLNALEYQLEYSEALNKIQFEHTLIHHRMSWLFTSQGFFTAAYFALKSPTFANLPKLSEYTLLLSTSAAITAIMFYCSILAAHLAMRIWRIRAEENRRDALISGYFIHFFGDGPASAIGLIFAAFWGSLISRDLKIYSFDGMSGLFLMGGTVVLAGIIWALVTRAKFLLWPWQGPKAQTLSPEIQ